MDNIYEIISEIADSDDPAILATIIHVEGSAYRKEGATMLFTEDARQLGVISAGCLETDLAIRANELFMKKSPQSYTVIYDMSAEDDLSWGRGAGCNGKVHILLEKVTTKMRSEFRTLHHHLIQGRQVTSVRILKDDIAIKTSYLTNDNQHFGDQNHSFSSFIPIVSAKSKSSRLEYIEDLKAHVYIQYYRPKPRLFVFGAGPDVRPLASIAVKTGFAVTVWDWRPNNYKQTYFPNVTVLQNNSIPYLIKSLDFINRDSVIIMTHDFQKDQEILHHLLNEKQINYLGILGPRKRTSRLLNGKEIPSYLHSPVGLSIGAEGPEEIAISIIADLIQTLRQS